MILFLLRQLQTYLFCWALIFTSGTFFSFASFAESEVITLRERNQVDREQVASTQETQEAELREEILNLEGVGDAGEFFNMNHLTALVMGFVAAGMIKSCSKITMDMVMAAGGGIAFLYAEYFITIDYDEVSEDMEFRYQVDSQLGNMVNEEQKKALEDLRDNYLDILEKLNEKKKWQNYSLRMLQSALVSAAIQVGIEMYAKNQCETIAPTLATCPGPCQAQCPTSMGAAIMHFFSRQQPRSSEADASETEAQRETIAACTPCQIFVDMAAYNNAICGGTPVALQNDFDQTLEFLGIHESIASNEEKTFNKTLDFFAERALDTIFPQAHASMDFFKRIVMGPGAGAAVALLISNWVALEKFFGTPMKRMIAYGVMYFGVMQGVKQTESDIETTEENIEKINQVLARFDQFDTGGGLAEGSPEDGGHDHEYYLQNPETNRAERTGIDSQIVQIGDDFPCLTGEGTARDGCPTFTEAVGGVEVPSELEMGADIGYVMDSGMSISDDIISGNITEETLRKRDSVNGMRGAIRERGIRAFDGLDPEDLERLNDDLSEGRKDLFNEINKSAMRVFQDYNTGPSELLASLGMPAPPKIDDLSSDESSYDPNQYQNYFDSNKRPSARSQSRNKGLQLGSTRRGDDYSLGTDDSKARDYDDEVEYQSNEISGQREASLFQIISMRYLRSGYERLSSRAQKESDVDEENEKVKDTQ